MQESKPSGSVERQEEKENLNERQSEATSKETLSDLEETEKVPTPRPGRQADESNLPSPDGSSDEDRKDNDGSGPT